LLVDAIEERYEMAKAKPSIASVEVIRDLYEKGQQSLAGTAFRIFPKRKLLPRWE